MIILMKQKGFSAILVIVLVALVIGGGYLFYQKQIKTTPSQQTKQLTPFPELGTNQYTDTTLGIALNLPQDWVVCKSNKAGSGFINLSPELLPPAPGKGGPGCGGTYAVTISRYFAQGASSPKPVVRQPGESFIDYVKQLEQHYFTPEGSYITATDSNLKVVDDHTVFQTIPGASMGAIKNIMYIENQQAGAFVISLSSGYSEDDVSLSDHSKLSDLSNFQIIASSISNAPIKTGDITGQMRKKSVRVENKGIVNNQVTTESFETDLGMLTNFTVTLYGEDKKTVVATTKTDDMGSYYFRIKPGAYYINDPGIGWQSITVAPGDIQTFDGGTIDQINPSPNTNDSGSSSLLNPNIEKVITK